MSHPDPRPLRQTHCNARRAALAWVLLTACTALPPGCVVHRGPSDPQIARVLPEAAPAEAFAYRPDARPVPTAWQINDEGERELVVTFPARADLPGDTREVHGHLLLPSGPRAPAVLVLPILGGGYHLARSLASYLAGRGLAALWIERRGRLLDPARPLATARDAFRAAVIDARRALDWLESCPLVRGESLGLFGVSRGGIVASLVAATDRRVRGTVLALAGGDIARILEESEEGEVIRFRDARVAAQGYSDERFLSACRQALHDVDPLTHAGLIDPRSVLMINALFDAVVPRSCSLALWRALGRPRLVLYPVGHYGVVLFLWHARALAADHLAERLMVSHAPPGQDRIAARHGTGGSCP